MTKQEIEAVLDRVRTWPLERQEDAAMTLIRMEETGLNPYELSEEETADLDAAERSGDASPEAVAAFFARFRA